MALAQKARNGLERLKKEAAMCVAAMWYSGRCSLKDSYAAQSYNGPSYPSVGSYADLAYQKYKSFGGRD